MDTVVRVACTNNFNCTKAEWDQLDNFVALHPNKYFFINSNINTPLLHTINEHDYKVVITANPNLTVQPDMLQKIYSLDASKIAFIRVKWLPNKPEIKKLIDMLLWKKYKVVLTLQRFNGKKSLAMYTDKKYYTFSNSRYRLSGDALQEVLSLVDSQDNLYACDRNGTGCQGCKQCANLTIEYDSVIIKSLNLSTSGVCKYNCPDCYAKTMQHFCVSMGHRPINYDKILCNKKQAGATKHIKDSLRKAA
jgi:hypothetical protein